MMNCRPVARGQDKSPVSWTTSLPAETPSSPTLGSSHSQGSPLVMANVLIQSSAFTYSRDDDTAIWVHAGWFDADVPGGAGICE